MADTKITALTALTAADPANDVIPIVDVSDTTMAASGTTKKISVNNILGASGTATLASATITGDLTVDTSTLKVDSTNNRVGIGTATPAVALDVVGAINTTSNVVAKGGSALIVNRADNLTSTQLSDSGSGGFLINNLNSSGINLQFAGVTALTLNPTANLVLKGGTAGATGVGVTFPAAQVASSDANCLDDYEEGTFTPTVTSVGGTGIVYVASGTDSGRYTKIGRVVTFQVRLDGTYTGTFSYIRVALPFTATASNPDSSVFGYNNYTTATIGGRTDSGAASFIVPNPQPSGNTAMYSGFMTS